MKNLKQMSIQNSMSIIINKNRLLKASSQRDSFGTTGKTVVGLPDG